jgi:hypothetical protein
MATQSSDDQTAGHLDETNIHHEVIARKHAQKAKKKKEQPWTAWVPAESGVIDPEARFEKPWYGAENDSDRGEGG